MWTLTGFADEIGPDLNEQLDTLQSEDMQYIELRSVWNKNVVQLTEKEILSIKDELDARKMGVSAIGSPIGKIDMTDDFLSHLDDFRRLLSYARILNAPYIRIFSFWMPDEHHERYRNEVIQRMQALVDIVEGTDITLVHENEKKIYGDTPARCHDILSSINHPQLRAAWDPANFVQCGVIPHDEGYELLRPYIDYVHIKDVVRVSGEIVVAGEGDGQIRETLQALHDSGFSGFFSLEPHLEEAGDYSGFSGAKRFVEAVRAFKAMLEQLNIAWQ